MQVWGLTLGKRWALVVGELDSIEIEEYILKNRNRNCLNVEFDCAPPTINNHTAQPTPINSNSNRDVSITEGEGELEAAP
jgi:hypothetical protein